MYYLYEYVVQFLHLIYFECNGMQVQVVAAEAAAVILGSEKGDEKRKS